MIKRWGNFTNESSSYPKKFSTIIFSGDDEVHALYIDGKLFKYGDYYHDKMEIWIKSFIEGVEYTGCNIISEIIRCKDTDLNFSVTDGGSPPDNLEDALFTDI